MGCGETSNKAKPATNTESKPIVDNGTSTEAQLQVLTSARTRIVWCQDQDDQRDSRGKKNNFKLLGFDTGDGKGEREILPSAGPYNKPLISPKGDRVVFTDFEQKRVYVVNWDGTGLRTVTGGFALDVWSDPQNGIEWVYVQTGAETSDKTFDKNPVRRCQLDNPKVDELVWNKTPVSARWCGNFQVSADGTKAAGLFPWPESGIAELPNKSWKNFGYGCWTGLAPDTRFWKFDGAHRNLLIYDPGSSSRFFVGKGKKVNLSTDTRVGGYEVYHPRWSNHERFLAMTGPYKVEGKGEEASDRVSNGGAGVEIFLGRFDSQFTQVEQWVQVTRNKQADFFPDVWIDPKGATTLVMTDPPVTEPPPNGTTPENPQAGWPGKTDGLVFLWENRARMNEVLDPVKITNRTCRVEPRGRAIYGRYFEMELGGGAFVAQGMDEPLLSACQNSHQLSLEALITVAKPNHPHSARVITFSSSNDSRNFCLAQENDKLIFVVKHSINGHHNEARIEIGSLPAAQPHHLIVIYAPGRLVAYLNGTKAVESDKGQGDFSGWLPQHLIFGDEWNGGAAWQGALEGIAIYNRVLSPEEAKEKSRLYSVRVKDRKPAEKLTVQARLKELSATPSPESIAPYRRCLVVHGYEVEKILSGKYDEKKLLVAHWGILDGQVLTNHACKLESRCELTVERFDDHPQLEGERLAMDNANLDLPLYYDSRR